MKGYLLVLLVAISVDPVFANQAALQSARNIAATCMARYRGPDRRLNEQVRLASVKIRSVYLETPRPDEEDFDFCEIHNLGGGFIDFTGAFTMPALDKNVIWICRETFKQGKSVKWLAQALVHETMHLVGVSNECSATRAELEVMDKACGGRAFNSIYVRNCGLGKPTL